MASTFPPLTGYEPEVIDRGHVGNGHSYKVNLVFDDHTISVGVVKLDDKAEVMLIHNERYTKVQAGSVTAAVCDVLISQHILNDGAQIIPVDNYNT